MFFRTQIAQVFSALGNERRLQIIESIERGTSNPGEISHKMGLPRSTVEKHIRVLVSAGLVEKLPGLTIEGRLRIYYNTTKIAKTVLESVRKIIESTIEDHLDK
ncbi:MAG: ArsR/SmtB family transcription factor [Candidatus Hodarchaeota archaeon]